jgi:hypothetical protein
LQIKEKRRRDDPTGADGSSCCTIVIPLHTA